ncbi:peritrophin-48-like isoform X3 [Phlebotomus papatasi]|uniref:peritrophin-48-like isoform X3 n=1 Tax=Phlebotomus papatasi TaxID=29031 RepID=UPI002483A521|nr:peritrophin-48-like isoform X3 [Phlebotomus papatasi]
MMVKASITVLVAVYVIGRASPSSAVPPPSEIIEFKCAFPDDYLYAVPGTLCRSYYKCQGGHGAQYQCPNSTVFNFFKQTCSSSSGVCYEAVCRGRKDGNYPDTTHACRRAFICRGGSLVGLFNCPSRHVFNGASCISEESGACEPPESTAIAYPYAGDQRCRGLPDGHNPLPTDCCRFLICANGEVSEEKLCPNGQRFDSSTKKCVPPDQVPCIVHNPCLGKATGLHADELSSNCRDYVKCSENSIVARLNCGDQGVFNGKQCVPVGLYECPQDRLPNPQAAFNICRTKSNGFHLDLRRGCRYYVKCTSGRIINTYECPNGNFFDSELRSCIPENKQQCEDPTPSRDCEFSIGSFQDKTDNTDCTRYFYCYNGLKTRLKCPEGKVFDGEDCVPKSVYQCPTADSNFCEGKPDGYYKDPSGGCRSYFSCIHGRKFTYLCAEGQIFNGSRCTDRRPGEQCDRDECVDKPDGYYPDQVSDCHKYFFCLRGEKITTLTCRNGKVFNGQGCVEPGMFSCQTFTPKCMEHSCEVEKCHRDGFFMDISSGCRNYFFCIGGKKSVLSCSEGHLFNGELCVPRKTFHCPSFCQPQNQCS